MNTEVAIVGGGPAGMVLGLLLAKKGIKVAVLEKNQDFAREFRGEVLQPRFLRAMLRVGLLEMIQKIPHSKFSDLRMFYCGQEKVKINFELIDKEFPYVTWMTQPDLLNGLWDEAKSLPNFGMIFDADVTGFQVRSDHAEITYQQGGSTHTLACNLVVAADGRFSHFRKLGDFQFAYKTHQMDVLWFEMHRPADYRHGADAFISPWVNTLILPKYPDKIQCGILLHPGTFRQIVREGASAIAANLKRAHPMFENFADQLVDFHAFSLLEGRIELLREWSRDRLLLIGDAAHTCSPAGAIGVTIAVETAITAAEEIIGALADKDFCAQRLDRVRQKRIAAVLEIHRIQGRAGYLLTMNSRWFGLIVGTFSWAARFGLVQKLLRRVLVGGQN